MGCWKNRERSLKTGRRVSYSSSMSHHLNSPQHQSLHFWCWLFDLPYLLLSLVPQFNIWITNPIQSHNATARLIQFKASATTKSLGHFHYQNQPRGVSDFVRGLCKLRYGSGDSEPNCEYIFLIVHDGTVLLFENYYTLAQSGLWSNLSSKSLYIRHTAAKLPECIILFDLRKSSEDNYVWAAVLNKTSHPST